jgi:uncharacterized protein (DUF305 family)
VLKRLNPAILIAAAAVILAAAALALLISNRPPGDNSAEAGFARDMSTHHAQAVEMAGIVRLRTEDPDIRSMTTDMVLTQQAQIGRMQGWLDAWGLPPTSTEPPMAWMGHPTEGRMPGMAEQSDINRLQDLPPDEADALFLRLMIPHHKSAIPMAEAALERTDRPEVTRLAEAIIAAQRPEIETMQAMLEERNLPRSDREPQMDMESMDH